MSPIGNIIKNYTAIPATTGVLEVDTVECYFKVKGGTRFPAFEFQTLMQQRNIRCTVELVEVFESEIDAEGYDVSRHKKEDDSVFNLSSGNWEFVSPTLPVPGRKGCVLGVASSLHGKEVFDQPARRLLNVGLHKFFSAGDAMKAKYSLTIDDYEWVNPSPTTKLVFAYKVSVAEHPVNLRLAKNSGGTNQRAEFGPDKKQGNVWGILDRGLSWGITGSAAKPARTKVWISIDEQSEMVYLTFDHFEGSLVHDPDWGGEPDPDTP